MKRPAAFTRNGNGMALLMGGCRTGFRTGKKPPSQRTLRRGHEKVADATAVASRQTDRTSRKIAAARDAANCAGGGGVELARAIKGETAGERRAHSLIPLDKGGVSPPLRERGGDPWIGRESGR